MVSRKNVMIRTRFSTIDECRQSCVDQLGKSKMFSTVFNKLYGEFNDNHFIITSDARGGGMFEFVGEFLEESNVVVMSGEIRLRDDLIKRHRLMYLFTYVFAAVLILSFNPIFILAGLLFLVMPLVNKMVLSKNNQLHEMILKKVI